MSKNNRSVFAKHKTAFIRSIILFVLGIPMMYIASFGNESTICLIISVVYVVMLLINGIICFPIIKDFFKKSSTVSNERCTAAAKTNTTYFI